MSITSSLRFLYIFWGSGLLCAGWAVVVSDNRTKKFIRIQTGGGRGPPVSTGRFPLVPLYSKKTIYIEMTFRNGL